MATTFSELVARKARLWLGGQTTLDVVAPASYDLEVHATTSDGLPLVLRAEYTIVVPSIDAAGFGDKKKPPCEEPLLLRAKLIAPPEPDHVTSKKKGGSCPRRVKEFLQHHIRTLAAGTTAEQALTKGPFGFVTEVLRRVNHDLAGRLLVYRAKVERFSVQGACNKVTVAMVPEEGAAPTPGFALQLGAKHVNVEFNVSVYAGETSFAVAVLDPATKKPDWSRQIKVGGVAVQVHMELDGRTTLRLKLHADQGGVDKQSTALAKVQEPSAEERKVRVQAC